MKYLIILFLGLSFSVGFAQQSYSLIGQTQYFEFHSNFWVNLHHFIYQQAKGDQAQHLAQDGYELIDIGDSSRIEMLSKEEQALLQKAISY